MFVYAIPTLICGSCGYALMHIDQGPYNAARKKGVVQVICPHRECADYDKPMEFDLPRIELRPTTAPEIVEQIEQPRVVLLN